MGTVNHDRPPELDVSRYIRDIGALKKLPPISTLLVVYVDDLLFCGRRGREVFEMLSEEVKLDEPVVITKFLGVHHHIIATPEK
eukprot:3264602-Amphidinium_carterae.1